MKRFFYLISVLLLFYFSGCNKATTPTTTPAALETPVLETSIPVEVAPVIPEPEVTPPLVETPAPIETPAPPEKPAPEVTPPPEVKPEPSPEEDIVVAQFDTVRITKQLFNVTKTEIQLVVEDLNKITFSKDYTRWLTYLSDEYSQNFSNSAVLEKVSASLPAKGIKLLTLKDYFTYVFVPSRQNMRVDDIQFVSPTRVYVIMEIAPKSPAAIYILEKTQNGWKLVLKNQ